MSLLLLMKTRVLWLCSQQELSASVIKLALLLMRHLVTSGIHDLIKMYFLMTGAHTGSCIMTVFLKKGTGMVILTILGHFCPKIIRFNLKKN